MKTGTTLLGEFGIF